MKKKREKTSDRLKRQRKKIDLVNNEWYSLRSILGYSWAIFFFLLGGREAGKSYAATDFFVRQFKKYGRPFYWLRLTENSAKKLLTNNAEKLVDPDLVRKYKLCLYTNGNNVYNVVKNDKGKIIKKTLMCRVLSLSTFYNDKGSGYFDKDFLNDPNMFYNICLDEMNREKNEKNSFDIVYSFVNQLENLVRSTKQRIRILCIGNTLEEASDLLCAFNFLPEDFGRYKLKKKRAVIEYIKPSQKYLERRKGTIADILLPDASTFTNKVDVDDSLVYKGRLFKPNHVIKFTKSKDKWFTIWDGRIVAPYNNEKVGVIAMRPYIDEFYNTKLKDSIISMFDARGYIYKNLITFKRFQKELELLKPRANG